MMKMKNLILVLFLALCIAGSVSAQRQETLLGGLDLTGIWGAPTYNFSSYNSDFVLSRGGFIGLEFNNTITLGYAWSRLRDEAELEDSNETFKLKHRGFLLSITPNSYKAIHPRINLISGGGRVTLSDGDTDRVYILQPSGGLEFNLFDWCRLGLEGGYRIVTGTDFSNLDGQDFSAPFGQIDLRFGISW